MSKAIVIGAYLVGLAGIVLAFTFGNGVWLVLTIAAIIFFAAG